MNGSFIWLNCVFKSFFSHFIDDLIFLKMGFKSIISVYLQELSYLITCDSNVRYRLPFPR